MNWFDYGIIHFLNSFAQRSWIVDTWVVQVSGTHLMVGGILMVMYWWAWMEYGKENKENREILVVLLFSTTVGVLAARALAFSLPFRQRPLSNPLLHFQLPISANPDTLLHWSSFPSDHAVVEFCLATGLWIVSRRLGAWAIGYSVLISLSRIYAGAHYPTDILAGALLGGGFAFLSKAESLKKAARIALNYLDRRPAALYALLFVCTYEVGEMYDSVRQLGILGLRTARRYPAWEVGAVAGPLLVAALMGALVWLKWEKRSSAA
jgi:undecaprenyl-diphosphatase